MMNTRTNQEAKADPRALEPSSKLWAALMETWPRNKTWRGFTASVIEFLYVFWVLSTPLLPFMVWLELGLSLLGCLGLRAVLLRTVLTDPLTVGEAPWRYYRPATYFLHRNFALHTTACLALLEADQYGSLFLLALGAAVDFKRESRIRRDSRALPPSSSTSPSLSLEFLIFTGAYVLLVVGLWVIAPAVGLPLVLVDGLSSTVGHLQESIPETSQTLRNHGDPGSLVQFQISSSLSTVGLIYFGVVKQRAVMEFFLSTKRLMISIRNAFVASIFQLVFVAVHYSFFSVYGLRHRTTETTARAYYTFSPLDALSMLGFAVLIGAFLQGSFGILTQRRAE